MPRAIDLTEEKFGRLKVLEKAGQMPVGKSKTLRTYWYCECECGVWTLTSTNNLRNGSTTSCGCRKAEMLSDYRRSDEGRYTRLTHGHVLNGCKSSEYMTWQQMKRTHPHAFEWNDFSKFIADVGHRPSPDHALSRHDIREPHGPNNTYWRHKDERKSIHYDDLIDEFSIEVDAIIGGGTNTRPTTADEEREGTSGGVDWEHAEERNRPSAVRQECTDISR